MDRRTFLTKAVVTTAFAGVAIRVTGCSDDGGTAPGTNGGNGSGTADVPGTVGTNHGHSVTITGTQIDAGNAVTLTLSQGAGHTHSVSLTAQEVMDIGAGTRVEKQSSSDDAHTHSVTFN